MDIFAPYQKRNTSFIVKNIITNSNKTVRIFQYPIPVGKQRDLLDIPGVAESDIRASLLKGEILHKLLAQEITIVFSDIDLLQFNTAQKSFLQQSGVVVGLDVSGSGGGLSATDHETLRQLIHFIDDGPADGFASGSYKEIIGQPFPASITWYVDSSKGQKIVEEFLWYNDSSAPTVIIWNMYAADGTTIVHTITDNIDYADTIYEVNRTRTIS